MCVSDSVAAAGFDDSSIRVAPAADDIDDVTATVRALLDGPEPPDAIFGWADYYALEVLSAVRSLGLRVDNSAANFLLVHFAPGAKDAAAADAFLCSRGVILRQTNAYGLPDCLRLTIGTEEANRAVVAALKEFMTS